MNNNPKKGASATQSGGAAEGLRQEMERLIAEGRKKSPFPPHPLSLCNNGTNVTEGTEGQRDRGTEGVEGNKKDHTGGSPTKISQVLKDLGFDKIRDEKNKGTEEKTEGTEGKSGEQTGASSLREPHPNFDFFIHQGKKRDIEAVIRQASVSESARFKVSPEHHYARLLKTSDTALADDKTWVLPVVFDHWYKKHKQDLEALTPAKDKETRLLDFLSAFAECKLGYGESPLSRAGALAKKEPPPTEVKNAGSEKLNTLACFCRELARQDDRGEFRFFLSSRSAAHVVGATEAMQGHRLLNALCAMRVLRITKKGTAGEQGKATRYQYIASDAEPKE
jgi:hypothetical protein